MRVKIISLGSAGVGKSCLIKRYCEKRFVAKYFPTIGVDFGVTRFQEHSINFFDLGGQPGFAEVREEFLDDVQGVLLVYDVSSAATFRALDAMLGQLRHAGSTPAIAVCANKTDTGRRAVDEGEARLWAESNGYLYFEASASSGDGVQELFHALFTATVLQAECEQRGQAPPTLATPSFSASNLQEINRVKAAKTAQECLGVTAQASEQDIKRAYRKLAALLHPDKNKAPGSEEAFKKLLTAYSALLKE
eukprot:m.328668 g.328668  ORF g.328668 m.328668 type:complete len:249 (+) comp56127_c0_seq1:11-757(+)